ncbi:N-acetyltransferase [Chryseobacterium carnipullorum]|uniref:N-acetyltransferase n=2 Tax=Chryseobacterium carnipullorum TaxID=1124835 RepID=A0A3G6NHI3_CHRCU|nr:GNAT family N-acetyltransferase [Chryseobacterium carnipullorum]AZA50425.1 N-acetyltransferase [Chryseobacterium carnipullorum]AZA65295.1 N-acetyltransferase [Chryseobacterium carnipullorum]
MEELQFRNADLEDLEKIVEIYNSTIPSRMVTADTENVSVESRKEWFEDHHPETRPLWIIENNDHETLGWVSFSSFYGRPAYNGTVEMSIYMDESCRGKGYGKKVMEYCIDRASGLGIKTLLGFIFSHNEASLKLFRNFGFEEWGMFPNVAVLDGIERSLTILGKRVG